MVGRKANRVPESLSTACMILASPVTTSRNPTFAFGARARDNDGLRTSQSIRSVRRPDWASMVAIPAATVDLPSVGKYDVRPITLQLPCASASTANLIERIASAYAEFGASTAAHRIFDERGSPSSAEYSDWFGDDTYTEYTLSFRN